jgi:hypothetical protein
MLDPPDGNRTLRRHEMLRGGARKRWFTKAPPEDIPPTQQARRVLPRRSTGDVEMTTLSRHGRLTGLVLFAAPWLAFQVLGADPYPRSQSADPSTFGLSNIDPADGSTSLCGPVGTRFNLEADAGTPPAPFPAPQQEESLDALASAGIAGADLVVEGSLDYRGAYGALAGSQFAYYVHRLGNDCTPQYEGGMPSVPDPLVPGNTLIASGNGVVRRDAVRGAFFLADRQGGAGTAAIVVERTTVANLISATVCPDGTHTDAQAHVCWPTAAVLNPHTSLVEDKPHMAVDERASGIGAGNVYVTATEFSLANRAKSQIWLAVCTNTLSSCSSAVYVSGSDQMPELSHVAVRPDGLITISYINGGPGVGGHDIKIVTCTPATAPAAPSCGAPSLVANEPNSYQMLASQDFLATTYPKHAHRSNGANIESFMVWEQCTTSVFSYKDNFGTGQSRQSICPKSQLMLSESVNGGAWSTPRIIDPAKGDQFFAWIEADRTSGAIHIAYYTGENDYWSQRIQVKLATINPGGTFPESVSGMKILTHPADNPAGDPLFGGMRFGDYIGVVGLGDRIYVGYHAHYIRGTFGTETHTQRDNYLIEVDP